MFFRNLSLIAGLSWVMFLDNFLNQTGNVGSCALMLSFIGHLKKDKSFPQDVNNCVPYHVMSEYSARLIIRKLYFFKQLVDF